MQFVEGVDVYHTCTDAVLQSFVARGVGVGGQKGFLARGAAFHCAVAHEGLYGHAVVQREAGYAAGAQAYLSLEVVHAQVHAEAAAQFQTVEGLRLLCTHRGGQGECCEQGQRYGLDGHVDLNVRVKGRGGGLRGGAWEERAFTQSVCPAASIPGG